MFKCGKCGVLTKPGEGATTLVVERRDREYPQPDGEITRGWEIVKEILVGPCCKGEDEAKAEAVRP
jgi:hypothetical protein